jgi:hypothetical protein
MAEPSPQACAVPVPARLITQALCSETLKPCARTSLDEKALPARSKSDRRKEKRAFALQEKDMQKGLLNGVNVQNKGKKKRRETSTGNWKGTATPDLFLWSK